jgi:hypothetical protein
MCFGRSQPWRRPRAAHRTTHSPALRPTLTRPPYPRAAARALPCRAGAVLCLCCAAAAAAAALRCAEEPAGGGLGERAAARPGRLLAAQARGARGAGAGAGARARAGADAPRQHGQGWGLFHGQQEQHGIHYGHGASAQPLALAQPGGAPLGGAAPPLDPLADARPRHCCRARCGLWQLPSLRPLLQRACMPGWSPVTSTVEHRPTPVLCIVHELAERRDAVGVGRLGDPRPAGLAWRGVDLRVQRGAVEECQVASVRAAAPAVVVPAGAEKCRARRASAQPLALPRHCALGPRVDQATRPRADLRRVVPHLPKAQRELVVNLQRVRASDRGRA